jgi:hypothetical protein
MTNFLKRKATKQNESTECDNDEREYGKDRATDFSEINPDPNTNRLHIGFFEGPYEKEMEVLFFAVR